MAQPGEAVSAKEKPEVRKAESEERIEIGSEQQVRRADSAREQHARLDESGAQEAKAAEMEAEAEMFLLEWGAELGEEPERFRGGVRRVSEMLS